METFLEALPQIIGFGIQIILIICTWRINHSLNRKEKTESEKHQQEAAMAEGVQSLLRESIVDNFNKYSDKGFCPIYAKESIRKVYFAYHNLGGNDVATELYTKLLAMPEEGE